jgi:hypothetical protein
MWLVGVVVPLQSTELGPETTFRMEGWFRG